MFKGPEASAIEETETSETLQQAYERMPTNKVLADVVFEMQRARIVGESLPLGKSAAKIYRDLQMYLQALLGDPSLEKFEGQVREVMDGLPAAEVRSIIKKTNEILESGNVEDARKAYEDIGKSIKFWQDEYFIRFTEEDMNFFNSEMKAIKAKLG